MITLTTKKAVRALKRELGARARQPDLMVLENTSGTFQVEALADEIEDFERMNQKQIDSDVIADDLMGDLVQWLKDERLLEQ